MGQLSKRLFFQRARKSYICFGCGRNIRKEEHHYRFKSYSPERKLVKRLYGFLRKWVRYGLFGITYHRLHWRSIVRLYCKECGDKIYEHEKALDKKRKAKREREKMRTHTPVLLFLLLLYHVLYYIGMSFLQELYSLLKFCAYVSLDLLIGFIIGSIVWRGSVLIAFILLTFLLHTFIGGIHARAKLLKDLRETS